MSLSQEIEVRIQRFVSEVNDLVRQEALQAVSKALGAAQGLARGPGRPRSNGTAMAFLGKGAKMRARRKGEKRTAAELAQLEASLFDHVRSHPGSGIEAIGRAIGLRTSELARPMKKLLERKEVRSEGQKRATKYFPVDGVTTASAGGEGRGRGRAAGKRRGGRKTGGRKRAKKR
jgi:hypothetical protein